jgi:hypothetical protein
MNELLLFFYAIQFIKITQRHMMTTNHCFYIYTFFTTWSGVLITPQIIAIEKPICNIHKMNLLFF